MTATSLNGLRNGASNNDHQPDERMDQVRELLMGDYVRHFDTKVMALEARIRELEEDLRRRVEALDLRLEALSGEVRGERRAAFDELARSIDDLGSRIKRIAKA